MTIPQYMEKYLARQDYEAYTATDHATWRFIMRQLKSYLSKHAVSAYVQGLEETGIPIDRIPRIEEMSEKLSKIGWQAVGVQGFIPPSFFIELLANSVLPIATDMRTMSHIGYTPAPDIVHEAAGHAPILIDEDYREFLASYSEAAYKAIISSEDISLYEAIRYLSDIKENPDTTEEEIKLAEARLIKTNTEMTYVSESAKSARFAWWTTEYGLIKNDNSYKIYGAGLLSSIGESIDCLKENVKKIPLSADCVNQSYDITKQQPQLFYTHSLNDLTSILREVESDFAYKKGGIYGLNAALRAKTVNSVQFDNGISISGTLDQYLSDGDTLQFIKFSSPSQLCLHETEINGHGIKRHPHGYSAPIGRFKDFDGDPTCLRESDCQRLGLIVGRTLTLHYENGFLVEGRVSDLLIENEILLVATFTNCRVTRGSEVFFEPEWGSFDLIFANEVKSVFAGPADRKAYGDFFVGNPTTTPSRSSKLSETEIKVISFFAEIRSMRESKKTDAHKLDKIANEFINQHPSEWLVGMELLQLGKDESFPWVEDVKKTLETFAYKDDTKKLIAKGLKITTQNDSAMTC